MVLIFLLIGIAAALDIKNVVFVILSQENKYNLDLAQNLSTDIQQQSEILYKDHPVIHLSHRDFPHVGGWIILPLIPRLSNLHESNCSWVYFLEDRTTIRLHLLLDVLRKYDSNKQIWIGHALHDDEATIIHHFAFNDNPKSFKYPNVASGFAISVSLLNSLSERIKESSTSDFSIDSSHELALFIWNKGAGQMLQHESALCNRGTPHCATFSSPFQVCGDLAPKSSLYFAVKTCQKYHKDRIPVVKSTWARHSPRITFFSDVRDESVPTVSLGIPNTEQGHCGKTVGILRYISEEIGNDTDIRWIIVSDDDTILSVSRMQQLLSCYDDSEDVALGERYGYNVHSPRGYNYITGGGGMVFSKPLLDKLTQKGACQCPSLNTPDDMFLGICIAGLGVSVTHSPFFHQARPIDYAPGYLETQASISFHKHWMIDPIQVYKKWFEDIDKFDANTDSLNIHIEL